MRQGSKEAALGEPGKAVVDQTGRELGPRALATREKLLEATLAELAICSLRELKVIDLVKRVGTSPATFYQYFRDVEEAVLQLAVRASREMPAVVDLIEGDWRGEAGLERARAIASAFVEHWDRHGAALRFRNTASDEGDLRFLAVRNEAMMPMLTALSRQIVQYRGSGLSPDEHPAAAAAAMGAILERLASYHTELENVGVTREGLIETVARIVKKTITDE